ncbi:MAG: polyprenyl synthetase family protein [Oligoflexia bacterium]|nr:polyprenyl synthetase family protein [Oligoflexia bacterium]
MQNNLHSNSTKSTDHFLTFLTSSRNIISQNLKTHLHRALPLTHTTNEIYHYAIFPTGKLFRPLLVYSIYCDLLNSDLGLDLNRDRDRLLSSPDNNHSLLASALEIHHSYTLVHDDLPALDNDDYRRNKLSTHKAWGEWKALLIGDGLLNISYLLLSKINHPNSQKVFKLISSSLGAKGLILGQILDLSIKEQKFSFSDIIKIHELKTARLIEVSILSSFLLSLDPLNSKGSEDSKNNDYTLTKDLFRLAYNLGISFQLLDDLLDINSSDKNKHEKEINPFIHFPKESMILTIKSISQVKKIIVKYDLRCMNMVVAEYLNEVKKNLEKCLELFNHLELFSDLLSQLKDNHQ